jgi:hypothetical protein
LGLDAVAVALVWQQALGSAARVGPGVWERLVLGLAVWLVYLLDRQFDAGRLDLAALAAQRHWLHRRYRGLMRGLIVAVSLGLAAVVPMLPAALVVTGAVLAGVTGLHLVLAQWRPGLMAGGMKETVVGTVFALGCAAHIVARHFCSESVATYEPGVAVSAGLLAALCTLNCLLISMWEQRLDRAQGLPALGGEELCAVLARLIPVLVMLSLGWTLYGLIGHRWSRAALGLAIALSTGALHWLNSGERPSSARRLAADLVLLTPVITLPLLHG